MYCQVVLKGSKIENIEKKESRMLEEVSLFLILYPSNTGPTILICNHFQTFHLCLFSVVDFHVWKTNWNSIRKNLKTTNKKLNISTKIQPFWNVLKHFLTVILLLGYFILLVLSVWSVSYVTYAKVAVPLWESIEDIDGLNCWAQEREISEYSNPIFPSEYLWRHLPWP